MKHLNKKNENDFNKNWLTYKPDYYHTRVQLSVVLQLVFHREASIAPRILQRPDKTVRITKSASSLTTIANQEDQM